MSNNNLYNQQPAKDRSHLFSPLGDGGKELQYRPSEDGGQEQQYPPSGDGGNLCEQLLAQGFSKQEIHSTIYKYIMQEIACKKAYRQLSFTGKIQWQFKNYLWRATRFSKHLTAKGLMLLKTQFAKKPKNPV